MTSPATTPAPRSPDATESSSSAEPELPSVRVRIDAGGREIEIEVTSVGVDFDVVASSALALWRATSDAPSPAGGRSQFGLVAAERIDDRPPSSTMDWPVDVPQ